MHHLYRCFRAEGLLLYVGAGLLYMLAAWQFAFPHSFTDALQLSVDLLTGASPAGFAEAAKTALTAHRWLWIATWVLHVLSWALIPVIIGTVVSRLVVRLERARARQNATERLKSLGARLGLTDAEITTFVADVFDRIDNPTSRNAAGGRGALDA